MDVSQTFDALVSGMKWSEIVSTIEDVILAEMQKVEAEHHTDAPLSLPLPSAPEVHRRQAASTSTATACVQPGAWSLPSRTGNTQLRLWEI